MISIDRLNEIFSREFGTFFTGEGTVLSTISDDEEFGRVWSISIKGRDVTLSEDGILVDSGLFIG